MVALLEAYDVTDNGRYLGQHFGFYQELEIRLKSREMVFCALDTQLLLLSLKEVIIKNMYFFSKMA